MGTNNTSIQEAASKWINRKSPKEYVALGEKYGIGVPTIEIWIKEVVMPWWEALPMTEKGMPFHWEEEINQYNAQIARLYLQEHKEKEEWIDLKLFKPFVGQMIQGLWSDGTETDSQWDGQNESAEIVLVKWKPSIKEEKVLPETVEEAADLKEFKTLIMNNTYYVDGNPEKDFKRSTIGAGEFENGLDFGLNRGAKWQKEQDRQLISNLLMVASKFKGCLMREDSEFNDPDANDIIDSAIKYLNH